MDSTGVSSTSCDPLQMPQPSNSVRLNPITLYARDTELGVYKCSATYMWESYESVR